MHLKIGFFSPNVNFLPLVWGTLRSYLETHNPYYSNFIFLYPITDYNPTSSQIHQLESSDVVLTSHYVWNHETILKVINSLGKNDKKRYIVSGGPHIPSGSSEFLENNPRIDFLVHGEGESAVSDILTQIYLNNIDSISETNISFRNSKSEIIVGQTKTQKTHLDFPSPYLRGYFNEIIKKNKAKNLKQIALWETNRGCPFSCSFCDWGSSTMSKVRYIQMDRIKKEIDFFADSEIEEIYICDANFGQTKRDLEISELLVEARLKKGYPKTIRVSNAKNATENVYLISKKLSQMNMLTGASLSLQTADETTLKKINRKNIRQEVFVELAKRFDKEDIHFFTELIFPLPGETLESFINGIDFLLELGNHKDIRVYELSLLPNAPINLSRETYQFKTINRPLLTFNSINTTEIVIETNSVSREDWIYGFTFSEFIYALHNGGYTQYISRFLNKEYKVKFKDFYSQLLNFAKIEKNKIMYELLNDTVDTLTTYLNKPFISQWLKVHSNEKAMKFLKDYGDKYWFIWQYLWLKISEQRENFYFEIQDFINTHYPFVDPSEVKDLIYFQDQTMLDLNYNPDFGKTLNLDYDWKSYFYNDMKLIKLKHSLSYADKYFGYLGSFVPKSGDKLQFARCAVGSVDPDTKANLFMHNLGRSNINLYKMGRELY